MEPLIVAGILESLTSITTYVTAAATAAGLDEEASYRLHLAVDEIATNIITHGYAGAGLTGLLELRVAIDESALTITIEDSGIAYTPSPHQLPDHLNLPLEQRRPGGLGIYLATHNVDKFSYERIGERNRHTLIVNRQQT